MKNIKHHILLGVAFVISLCSIAMGIMTAVFGSQADTSPDEQTACLRFGILLTVIGVAVFLLARKPYRKIAIPLLIMLQTVLFFAIVQWGY